jgi:type IV secretory pathway VirB10-like protein
VKPSDDDLEEFVKSVLPAETAGTMPAAAASPPEPPPRAAQPEATKAAEQEVDKAMEEIFSAPSAREAAAEASRAADRVIEARGRELTGEERKRALLEDVPTGIRREKLLDDLPISIRKRFAEGTAGRRRIAMMMKRVLPSDEVLEKMMITGDHR